VHQVLHGHGLDGHGLDDVIEEPMGLRSAPPPSEAHVTADPEDRLRADRLAAAHDRAAAAQLLHQAQLARQAAAEDRRLAELLRQQASLDRTAASVDELTGALRRSSGFAALEQEIDRCQRANGRLVIGFVDVDGLKHVNDIYGHQAGDSLLRAVVTQLKSTLRSYDVVVRFGGDEFIYSLADAELGAAVDRFGRMQASLAHFHASASAGFAELREDDTLEMLIARADADLYDRRDRRDRKHA
jgi:diguanylate cyclase (GGDEF)-like protein